MSEEFKASNGWLASWKQHYISYRTVSGESGDVSNETVESCLEHLPSILAGYEAQDIWNCEETGLFWKKKERLAKGEKNQNYDLPFNYL